MQDSTVDSALDNLTVIDNPNIFVTANGIRLKLKKVARLILVEAQKGYAAPKPPMMFNEDKGRQEENPLDPDFLAAVNQHNFDMGMLGINVFLTFGTEVLSLPDGIYGPDDNEWTDSLDEFNIIISSKKRQRYVQWLKYYALDDVELNELSRRIMRVSGMTPEEDVAVAAESFPGDEKRDSNT
jgi:hypothetical protein